MLAEFIECMDRKGPPEEVRWVPFIEAIWPWMGAARKRLQEKAKDRLSLLSPKALLSMESSLAVRWSDCSAPSILKELGLSRVDFSLQGATPEERYLEFIQKRFLDPEGLSAFFHEYKGLARFVSTILHLWVDQAVEFLFRLESDLPLLANVFNEGIPLGKVSQLGVNAGDTHENGRSVSIVTFESGKSVIYKPKNLDVIKNFNSFLDECNHLGLAPPLKSYTVLPRGDYGWEEKVEHLPCNDLEEAKRYFERGGMYLCLMDLFLGTDVHYENIIASGEHPLLIDLETIFCSVGKSPDAEETENLMAHSVLFTGLLPNFQFGKKQERGVDLGGLSSESGVAISFLKWEHLGTDEIELVSTEGKMSPSANEVICHGAKVRAKDHVDSIVHGFKTMYTFALEQRPFIEMWISRMANDPVRFVPRPTRLYACILKKMVSSHAMMSEESVNEKLNILDLSLNDSLLTQSLVSEEKKALLQGDIPCFHTFPSSGDLYSQKQLIAKDCLENSQEKVVRRLKKMGIADRKIQETFIRQSFYAADASLHGSKGVERVIEGRSIPSREKILTFAIAIGENLKEKAFESEDGSLGWISLEPNFMSERYELLPVSDALYSGRTGIALFFAALSRLSGDKHWEKACMRTLSPLRKWTTGDKPKQLILGYGLGGMSGVGGIIYGLLQIGRLLQLPSLIEEGRRIIRSIDEKHISEDLGFDVIAGSAGLLLSLLTFQHHFPEPSILQLATACGDHLCKNAKEMGHGLLGWNSIGKIPSLGFSHGSAGFANALFKLAKVTGEARFRETALKTLAYERSYYSPEYKNWPRLEESTYCCGWCHGATGIGLGRLALSSFVSDPEFSHEIQAALDTTSHHIPIGGLDLCCGLSGRLEFLLEASKVKKGLDPMIETALSHLFYEMQHGKTEEFYKPGLMKGEAGIGYTLLRLIDQEKCLPQVLLLT